MFSRCHRVFLALARPNFSTHTQDIANRGLEAVPFDDVPRRLLKVAVIGVPNSGKSTFINNLMDRKVCATSAKVHTTKVRCRAIFTDGDAQIVFLDTPGLVNFSESRRYGLERSFLKDCRGVLQDADVVGVIHDTSNLWTRHRLDIKVIRLLEEYKMRPSFLVFNKVDVLKSKRVLLDLVRVVTDNCIDGKPIPNSKALEPDEMENKGWPYFKEVFMVSSLNGTGLEDVKKYLINEAKPGKWMFPAQVWSDQSVEQIILNSARAKLLDFLPQEIPYQLKPELEYFDVNSDGVITASIVIQCPSERKSRLVSGVGDGKLRQITESLQHDLQDTFQNYVRLKLVVSAPENK